MRPNTIIFVYIYVYYVLILRNTINILHEFLMLICKQKWAKKLIQTSFNAKKENEREIHMDS